MIEFTGERVVPGQVDPDLWNEHFSRYLFASRLSRRKRVVDVGCGAGYGTAELARWAYWVVGIDNSIDAIRYAVGHYPAANARFVCASGTALPLPDASVDLVVAFEMIEHLPDWPRLLSEARRVLAPGGQFVVSTPNKVFYEESRKLSGPNPFHAHEFTFDEFRSALAEVFPHVALFVQNHGPAVVFHPVGSARGTEVRLESASVAPEDSNFFIAVCAQEPMVGSPAFVYLPSAANVLRERARHIEKLESELATKDEWLEAAKAEHQELLEKFRALEAELEERNEWAEELDAELDEARRRLDEFHAQKETEIAELSSGYEAKIAALEAEVAEKARWASETQKKLDEKSEELAKCVEALDDAENRVKERTEWALKLDREVEALRAKLAMVESSRWVKLGKAIGVGPGARLK